MIRRSSERIVDMPQHKFGAPGFITVNHLINDPDELNGKGRLFSHTTILPGNGIGYHVHAGDSEIYYILSGKGEYQVDGVNIPLQEGSVVRVSPEGKRAIHNNGTEPMVVLCVQYRETPFTQEDAHDGVILQEQVKW